MRVDFYLLEDPDPKAKWHTACRLLEKAYLRDHRVFVYCNHQQDAEQIDECLWTFKEDSFIPHNLLGEGPETPPPIQIGFEGEPRGFHDILLNLSDLIPPSIEKFKRIMEIVPPDEQAKQVCREHYRVYRSKAFQIHTHRI